MKLRCPIALPMLLALLVSVSVSALAGPASPDAEALARKLEGELIAPCCWSQTIAEHRSEAAEKMRQEIRDMVRKGMSHPQIVEFYVARYGERILAAPRPKGFNLTAYILPGLGILIGAGIVTLLLVRRKPAATSPVPRPKQADDPYLARMERELKDDA